MAVNLASEKKGDKAIEGPSAGGFIETEDRGKSRYGPSVVLILKDQEG